MRLDRDIAATPAQPALPRARGTLALAAKSVGPRSMPDRLRTSGCLRALFPRHPDRCEAIVINTSGGLTSGDRLSQEITAGAGSRLTITTQAAERAYSAPSGHATISTQITAEPGAMIHWLPQELILFNRAALKRRLSLAMAADARALLVEPVVFGRPAMGERVTEASFSDRLEITRDGTPLFLDATRLTGDIAATMERSAVGGGAGAMAALVYIAPDAQSHLTALRNSLPSSAGASLIAADTLVARFLAPDAFILRRSLLPVLDRLSRGTLPTSWRL